MSFVLLGILNSQASAAGAAGDYELLETTLITTNTASVTFSNLGNYSDYKHLQVRIVARTSDTTNDETVEMRVNGEAFSTYTRHGMFTSGATRGSFGVVGTPTAMRLFSIANQSDSTDIFGGGFVDILNFSNTNVKKTVRAIGSILGTYTYIRFNSGLWDNAGAMTSITFLPESATNFVSGSRFSLYGIRG